MFDWRSRVRFLRDNPGFNNAGAFNVVIKAKENANWIASIYHLSPDENQGQSLIHIEVLCKQNERQKFRAVLWGSEEMTPEQLNQIGAIFADKPDYEIKNHPIAEGQRIWLEISGGDRIVNLNAMPDRPDRPASDGSIGNARHHHSYLVLFQEANKGLPNPNPEPPIPDPEPTDPDPEPPTEEAVILIDKEWIDSLGPGSDGFIRIYRR
jgi:hypothetical protein